jgi:hypothetical protein
MKAVRTMNMTYPLGLALALAVTAAQAPANSAPVAPAGPVSAQSRAVRGAFPYKGPLHELRGVVRAINGTTVTLQTRAGLVAVDASYAMANYLTAPLFPGRPVLVHAALDGRTVVAHDIARERLAPGYWPADR